MERFLPVAIGVGSILVSTGIFVGGVRYALSSVTKQIDAIGKRMDVEKLEREKALDQEREDRKNAVEALREDTGFQIGRVCTMCREYREDCKGDFRTNIGELKIEMNERFGKLDERIKAVADTTSATREILLLMASPEVREAIIAQQARSR